MVVVVETEAYDLARACAWRQERQRISINRLTALQGIERTRALRLVHACQRRDVPRIPCVVVEARTETISGIHRQTRAAAVLKTQESHA